MPTVKYEGAWNEEGYVQSARESGVFVLSRKPPQTEFKFSDIESIKEAAERNHLDVSARVARFTELVADGAIHALTGFPEGEEIYYLRRVRSLGGEALILDHNYFLKSVARGLSPKIAEASIYEYMERVLKEKIVTTQRKYTGEVRFLDTGNEKTFAYERKLDGQRLTVVYSFSGDEEAVTLAEDCAGRVLISNGAENPLDRLSSGRMTLRPFEAFALLS